MVSGFGDAEAIAVQPDGRIIVSGSGDGGERALVRYLPDGRLDPSFGGDGMLVVPGPDIGLCLPALAVGANGRSSSEADGWQHHGDIHQALMRYTADGRPTELSAGGGSEFYDRAGSVEAVAVQRDGGIVAAGTSGPGNGGGKSDFVLVRYNSDGSLDS